MNNLSFARFDARNKHMRYIAVFALAAAFFTAFSVFATDIGTNITATGSVFATSTVVATGNITTYGSLGVGSATSTTGGIAAENADITRMQVGTGSVISKMQFGTCSVNPPMLKAGTGTTTTCTATGITTSDKVWVTAPGLPMTNDLGASTGNIVFVAASSTAADTIRIQIVNTSTSTAVDAAAATWSWLGIR